MHDQNWTCYHETSWKTWNTCLPSPSEHNRYFATIASFSQQASIQVKFQNWYADEVKRQLGDAVGLADEVQLIQ